MNQLTLRTTLQKRAMTLMELLVSLVIIAGLSGMMAFALKTVDSIKAKEANAVAISAIEEVEVAYEKFLATGGWINDNTHISMVMEKLPNASLITDTSITFNNNTTETTCNTTYSCYRLTDGAIVAFLKLNSSTVTSANGYFVDDDGDPTAGVTSQLILVDPDGQFSNSENSKSARVYMDQLGRIGMENTNQPAYFSLN